MGKKYICDECQQECESGWTEEEALAEKEENGWGDMDPKDMAQICDPCYQQMAKQFGFTVQGE